MKGRDKMLKINKKGYNYYEYLVVDPYTVLTGWRCDWLIITLNFQTLPKTVLEMDKYKKWYMEHAQHAAYNRLPNYLPDIPIEGGNLLPYTEWILNKFYPDDHEDNLTDKAYSLVEQWERENE